MNKTMERINNIVEEAVRMSIEFTNRKENSQITNADAI